MDGNDVRGWLLLGGEVGAGGVGIDVGGNDVGACVGDGLVATVGVALSTSVAGNLVGK